MLYYLSVIVVGTTGAISTFALHHSNKRISPILASAVLTLFITLICQYLEHMLSTILFREIPYVFIGGSFIGMSTRKKAKNYLNITLASVFYSLIYLKSSQLFHGYGGALGISACISILIVITSSKLLTRSKHIIRRKRKKQYK